MSRRITTRATRNTLETMQARIDTLADKADPELAELLLGVSASLELAIAELYKRTEFSDKMRAELNLF